MATSYELASAFLREIGAPDTPNMRRAVAIWLRFESGGTIVGNNPFNLHSGPECDAQRRYCPGQGNLPGQIGNRYAGPGDKNVAVFATAEDGMRANARNLTRLAPRYGYGEVIAQARKGDAFGFLKAIQDSNWSAGNYGYSKLTNAFMSRLNWNFTVTSRMPTGSAGGTPTTPSTTSNVPIVTRYINEFLAERGLKSTDTIDDATLNAYVDWLAKKIGQDNSTFKTELKSFISGWRGQTWGSLANTQMPKNTSTDPLVQLGSILAFLLDGENWVFMLALGGGVILAGYSFTRIAGMRVEPV